MNETQRRRALAIWVRQLIQAFLGEKARVPQLRQQNDVGPLFFGCLAHQSFRLAEILLGPGKGHVHLNAGYPHGKFLSPL